MVQFYQPPERKPSFGAQLSQGIGNALNTGAQLVGQRNQKQAIESLLGPEAGDLPPEFQKMAYEYQLKSGIEGKKKSSELQGNKAILRDLENKRGLEPGSLSAYENDIKLAETITRPTKTKEPAVTAQEVPPDQAKKIKKILADNPNDSADDLRIKMDEAGIFPIYSNSYTENRRRTEEQSAKTKEDQRRELRQETLPMRKQLAEKAFAAQKGIENKEQLLDIIERGDIDDPTFAALAESLPMKLGKRLLSNDTVEYKAGLVEEFGDLRNIFQGQTRVKEIELLEEKIADLYLTDDQKKAILKSRINALKADTIRAEVAQEIENQPYGVLQFQQELDKRTKPKLEALFNQILDEQKSIIQNAENRKNVPLDLKDSDDIKIIDAILEEAKGDSKRAKEIAKKKGYSW